ncbi:DEAD/DEAH box helicase [Candidatus Gracilibacteria bacterium]|nr:DEAD/DEAH box helicase [Candidatus Gracilibacteria bacterium]
MIIALDLETTGLDNSVDSILEVALVKFDAKTFKVIDTFSTLVNPEVEIPELITNITSIKQEDVLNSPIWENIIDTVTEFIGDSPILGHNTQFDSGFLRSNGVELKNNIEIDTFEFANFLLLDEKSLSLESLSTSLGIKLEGAHRALNDTMATMNLFEKLIIKLNKASKVKKSFFDYISQHSENTSLKYVLTDILEYKSEPINDEGFLKILLKALPKLHKPVKRVINSEIDLGKLETLIEKNDNLELRQNQQIMSTMVGKAFTDEEKIVLEAPTGVGKTFAYLLPSITHSIKTGEQVFVSTSTKALQDQIFYNDLDFLSKKFGYDFSYSKLKGKSNYIGIFAFVDFMTGVGKLTRHESSFVLKILFWLMKTKSGELDELDFYGKEYSFLKEINADDSITFSQDNTYEKYEFAVNARRNARKANIVVINNNILFQDIDGDNNILGKVENLVLDEAHTLEDVVTNSLKKGFCLRDFEKHLISIEKILKKYKINSVDIKGKIDNLIFEMGIIFDTFQMYLNIKVKNDDKYQNILINDDFYNPDLDDVDKKELSNLIQLKITDFLDQFSIVPDKVYLALGREIQFLEGVNKVVNILLDKDDKNKYIKLLNYNEHRGGLVLEYTHLNVGNYLEKHLWNKLHSCILTSATLQVAESFDYINTMLHLESFSCSELESDFDYSKQALLFIPDDLGSIKNNLSSIIAFVSELMTIVKGNTLVLFTAFYAIKECYRVLAPLAKKENLNVYAQSIGGGKHKLIEAFKHNADKSFLLGTDTFWEGIDIPGEDLKFLVIHKAPFMVPTDPIFQARSSLFKNAFMEYGVPKSILKLKQGFGRLIRTKTDTGIVIFLDDRIYSTGWGEIFYKAFPSTIKTRKGPADDFLKILEDKKKD